MHYKKIFILVIVFLVIIPPLVFSLSIIFPNNQISKQLNPVFKKVENKIENPIGQISNEYLINGDGDYAVYIKNLKTGEEYKYNENRQFNSASLYKLWLMAITYGKINNNTIKEDDILSSPKYKLEDQLRVVSPTPLPPDVSPSPIPENPESISFSVNEAINKMIVVSDNYAALLLASKSGNFSVIPFLNQYGFKNSNFKQPPQTTAADIGRFYELLYRGEMVDRETSDKMISILKMQTLNDRIPLYLPDEVEIAHKTGELLGSKHDAGIVYAKNGDYIIVVLTDTQDPVKAAKDIAIFSREVYKYFENQK